MIKNFTYTAAVFWAAVGIINIWLAVVMSKTSLFSEHKNKVHAFQAVTVWSLAALLALMPYLIDGENGYDNFLLCYGCPRPKEHLGYFFMTLAQEIGMIIGGLFIVHLIYKLKVQVRLLGASVQINTRRCVIFCRTLFEKSFFLKERPENSRAVCASCL